jgi:zinc protease
MINSLFVLFSILSAFGDSSPLPLPKIETLPNGLQVVWFLDDRLPILDFSLFVKSGYRDEPDKKTGISQILVDSLERGAAGLNSQEIAKAIEKLGASYFASAEEDSMVVGIHGLSTDGMTLMELLGKLVLSPDFALVEVKREKARILDRWSHVADYGEVMADLVYSKRVTANTSYGRGKFFSKAEFQKIERDDVLKFYKGHFVPGNAVLMVVGRANQEQFREKINSIFGSWSGNAPKRQYKNYIDTRVVGTNNKSEIFLIDKPNSTQAQVRMGFKIPLIQSAEHYPLTVANALLGGYFNSRLNSLIRDKLGLTYGISSSLAYSKELGTFTISSSTRNETVAPLLQKALGVLETMKRGPLPNEEVDMAKKYLTGGFPLSVATLNSIANRWMLGEFFNLGTNYLNEFVPKIGNVNASQVLAAFNANFKPEQTIIVLCGDAKQIEKSLREAKFQSIKKISPGNLFEHL